MDAIQVVTLLYGAVGIINIIGYIPQIKSLIKSENVEALSLKTWSLWTTCTMITFAYSLLVSHDMVFKLVTASSMLGTTAITMLIYYKRSTHKRVAEQFQAY